MINVDIQKNSPIVHVKVDGKIEADDWTKVASAIDPVIVEHMSVSLLLDATDFNGWDDMEALRQHFNFVKLRHENVDRIALLTGREWQTWAAGIARIFVDTDIRIYEPNDIKDALDWLASDQKPAFTILATGQPDVLGINVNGKLTGADYEKTLIPLMEEMLKSNDKISCYVDMSNFDSLDISAFWQDFTFSIRNWNSFNKVAMVGLSGWMENVTVMFDKITPTMDIKCFDRDDKDDAWQWVKDT